MTDTDWPYDTDRDDPLINLRIPVTSSHPDWCYLVAFDRDSAARPTDTEARMMASFREEYIAYWYNDSYKARMAELPFDIDGGANGVVFRKWGENDWAYRRRTWTYGPTFVPHPPRLRRLDPADKPFGPLSLADLMDHMHMHGGNKPLPRWQEWKAAHPEVFGAES
jgi:hypothetical protein